MLEDALDGIEEQWIKTIDDYHFPVVTLSDKTEPDALCTIFETLNRTGVKLSVFELLTARFWPQNINLRALWDKALADHPVIADFEVDPYYVLQGISLASRKAPSCKRSDVLNLAASDITEWWDKVVLGLATGLEILRDDCKVMLPKWLPYQTMLPPLAAVLARAGSPKTAEAGAQREKLKRWFWCAVFGQVYESAPNSKSAKDVVEILPWLAGGDLPESVASFRFDPRALRDVTPRQRSIYRGAICLILGGGARDFHTQAVITGKLMAEEGIDDHHVFPAAYLRAPRCRAGAHARLRAQPHADRPHDEPDDQRPRAVRLSGRDPQARPGSRSTRCWPRTACLRATDSPLLQRRLRGVPRVAAGAAVAGDPARHGRDGGRGSRSRRRSERWRLVEAYELRPRCEVRYLLRRHSCRTFADVAFEHRRMLLLKTRRGKRR